MHKDFLASCACLRIVWPAKLTFNSSLSVLGSYCSVDSQHTCPVQCWTGLEVATFYTREIETRLFLCKFDNMVWHLSLAMLVGRNGSWSRWCELGCLLALHVWRVHSVASAYVHSASYPLVAGKLVRANVDISLVDVHTAVCFLWSLDGHFYPTLRWLILQEAVLMPSIFRLRPFDAKCMVDITLMNYEKVYTSTC